MTDLSFEELLNQTANLSRPQVEIGGELQVAKPAYQLLAVDVAIRLRPTAADLDRALLGRFPQAVAVAYLLPTDLAANDRLAQVDEETLTLSAPLNDGFAAGDVVEAVVSYDVLGVLDESAAGHHLKVALKRREL